MRDYDAILNTSDEQLSAADLIERSKGVDAILTCSTELFSAEVIEGLAPSVKAVATFSVGYEHIDTAAAKKRGLIATNTPDVLTDATADLTILLMLGQHAVLSNGVENFAMVNGAVGPRQNSSAPM